MTSATVIAEIYIDEVFDPHVKLFRDIICNNFLLMDDNARSHRVTLVTDYLLGQGKQQMELFVYSLDLNPIEHMWDSLGRRIASR